MATKHQLAVLPACMLALGLSACGGGGGSDTPSSTDPDLELTVVNASTLEGDSGTTNLAFTVTANQTASADITVGYTTADGTATAGSDYTAVTAGSVVIPAGSNSATFNVEVLGDTDVEPDETFTLNFTGPDGETATATATIQNDDTAATVLQLSVDDVSVNEGNAGTAQLTFTVSLDQPAASAITVDYATANGSATAGSDYAAASGTLSFAAGEQSKTVTVEVSGDTLVEADETLTITLSNATGDATIADAEGVGTINNDDLSQVSVDDVSVAENGGSAVFTVSLDQASPGDITLEASTADGSATAGSDYTALSGQAVTILAGDTQATVSVAIIDDADVEASETFTITLSNLSANATLGDGTGEGTITNDDTPELSVSDVRLDDEGDSGSQNLAFTIALRKPAVADVTVDYSTADGSANAGVDYTVTSGTATILAGQQAVQVSVPVAGDTVAEDDETFSFSLSNASANAVIASGGGSATGTIENDDQVDVSATDVSVDEGDAGQTAMTFTVELSAAAEIAIDIDWSLTAGSATAGEDYVADSGTLTIAAGSTSGTINVQIEGDGLVEGDEDLTLNLSTSSAQANVTTASVTGTISNDDQPLISVQGDSVVEGDGGPGNELVFTVALDQSSSEVITVDYATVDGTATAGEDYTADSGTLTFAIGETVKTVAIAVSADTDVEGDEDLSLSLSNVVGNASIDVASAVGTIENDDLPTISIAPAMPSALEGDDGDGQTLDFIVTLSDDANGVVDVTYSTGGAGDTATSGVDYTPTTGGTVSIAPGSGNSTTISVPILGDGDVEDDETVTVTLVSVTANAEIASASATGTIADDDQAVLNDTGVTSCGTAITNGEDCATLLTHPMQDGDTGRDVSDDDDSDGLAGFKFTKLDATGNPLAADAPSWSCVRDDVTGLVWEVKTDDDGLHDRDNVFTWYDSTLDAGTEPVAGTADLDAQTVDNTEAYVDAVNTATLCGYDDWRMPDVSELLSIAHLGLATTPALDDSYFPNALPAGYDGTDRTLSQYWTGVSSRYTFFPQAGHAWVVGFDDGHQSPVDKATALSVRLVRSEPEN